MSDPHARFLVAAAALGAAGAAGVIMVFRRLLTMRSGLFCASLMALSAPGIGVDRVLLGRFKHGPAVLAILDKVNETSSLLEVKGRGDLHSSMPAI